MKKSTAQVVIVLTCIAGGVALRIHNVDGAGWLVVLAILALAG